jgi:hypothetical protein
VTSGALRLPLSVWGRWGHYAQRAQYAADTWVPTQALRKEGQYGLAVTSHSYLHHVWCTNRRSPVSKMGAALDVLVVVAARVPTESLLALATGSDAAHAPVWAFEVTGDVISAGEPGGHMSVRKITDNGGLL